MISNGQSYSEVAQILGNQNRLSIVVLDVGGRLGVYMLEEEVKGENSCRCSIYIDENTQKQTPIVCSNKKCIGIHLANQHKWTCYQNKAQICLFEIVDDIKGAKTLPKLGE